MKKLTEADRAQWRNVWCILRSLDWPELDAAGAGDIEEFGWYEFRAEPHRYLLRTDDRQASVIWRAVEKRLK